MGKLPNLLPMLSIATLRVKVFIEKGECNDRYCLCSYSNHPSPGYPLRVDPVFGRIDQTTQYKLLAQTVRLQWTLLPPCSLLLLVLH